MPFIDNSSRIITRRGTDASEVSNLSEPGQGLKVQQKPKSDFQARPKINLGKGVQEPPAVPLSEAMKKSIAAQVAGLHGSHGADLAINAVRRGTSRAQLSQADGQLMLDRLEALGGPKSEKTKKLQALLQVKKSQTGIRAGSLSPGKLARASATRQLIRKAVLNTYLKTGSLADAKNVRDKMVSMLTDNNKAQLKALLKDGASADQPIIRLSSMIARAAPGELKDQLAMEGIEVEHALLAKNAPFGAAQGIGVDQDQPGADPAALDEQIANDEQLAVIEQHNEISRKKATDRGLPPDEQAAIDKQIASDEQIFVQQQRDEIARKRATDQGPPPNEQAAIDAQVANDEQLGIIEQQNEISRKKATDEGLPPEEQAAIDEQVANDQQMGIIEQHNEVSRKNATDQGLPPTAVEGEIEGKPDIDQDNPAEWQDDDSQVHVQDAVVAAKATSVDGEKDELDEIDEDEFLDEAEGGTGSKAAGPAPKAEAAPEIDEPEVETIGQGDEK